jgi:hypothetical protein
MFASQHIKRRPLSNAWSGVRVSFFTISNLGYSVSESSGSSGQVMSRVGRSQGKFYFEVQLSAVGTFNCAFGIRRSDEAVTTAINLGKTCAMRSNGTLFTGDTGASTGAGAAFSTGNRGMGALHMAPGGTNKLWLGVNGTWANSGNPAAGTGALFSGFPDGEWHIFAWTDNDVGGAHDITLANGQSEILTFNYSVPDGFERGLRY